MALRQIARCGLLVQPNTLQTPLQGYFYYIFGFAFLVAVLTIIITIEVSIVCTYVQVGSRAGLGASGA